MNEIDTINAVANILSEGGEHAVSEYASWYVIASFSWIAFGATIMSLCLKAPDYLREWEFFNVVQIAGIIIGMIFIFANIADLFSPEAIAIHRLIMDIRG